MAGHVSKASDVYAYGILLYEIITGRRAYTGVPIPLLPHEVAMQGLRPEWPNNMPAEVCRLRDLAEACWQHKPQDRYVCTVGPSVLLGSVCFDARCSSGDLMEQAASVCWELAPRRTLQPKRSAAGCAKLPASALRRSGVNVSCVLKHC